MTAGPLLKGLAFQETQNKARCKGPSIVLRKPYEMPTDSTLLPAAGVRPFLPTFCGRLDKK